MPSVPDWECAGDKRVGDKVGDKSVRDKSAGDKTRVGEEMGVA